MLQAGIAGRFVLGAVFVGFSRPQFNPACVPRSSMLPVAIVVVAMDAVLVTALAITAFTSGVVREVRGGRAGSGRSKSILLVIIAFAIWTAVRLFSHTHLASHSDNVFQTSVAMLLGMAGTSLLLRTLLPSLGLLILVRK